MRIGIGWDMHRLEMDAEPGQLRIGGIDIPSSWKVLAHSDGDVLIHALIDALVGPLGVGNVGQLYPDTDPRYLGSSSLVLLQDCFERFLQMVSIQHIDAVVVLDQPRLNSYIPSMQACLSQILRIPAQTITIKPKTCEALFPHVVQAQVVALLDT